MCICFNVIYTQLPFTIISILKILSYESVAYVGLALFLSDLINYLSCICKSLNVTDPGKMELFHWLLSEFGPNP